MLRIPRRLRRGLDRANLRALGLDPAGDYDAAELRRRFVQLAKLHHPDVAADSQRFLQVRAAYDALTKELGGPPGAAAPAPPRRAQRAYRRVWRPPAEEQSRPRPLWASLPLFELLCLLLFFGVYSARFREGSRARRPSPLEQAVGFHRQAAALQLPRISAETCARHSADYLLSLERRRLAQLPAEVFEQICERLAEA